MANVAPASSPDRFDRRAGLGLFLLVLVAHVWISVQGWRNPPLDGHEFRQAQTAISARYLAQDGLRLDYATPILGKPWSIPLEFPLFQGVASVVARKTGLPVHQAARLVALFFFYLTLPAVYLLAGRLSLPPARRWLVIACILGSPVYLFYQRAVLIESTALCLGAWFLYFFWAALGGGVANVAAAIACGAVAGMVKGPTLAAFLAPAAALVFVHLRHAERARARLLLRAGVMLAGALGAAAAWTAYADQLKRLNPLARDLQSAIASRWMMGEPALRIDPTFWKTIATTSNDTVLRWPGLLALAVGLALVRMPVRRQSGWLLLCYLAPIAVFANVYLLHDYYFFANGVFLLGALALVLNGLLDRWRWFGWVLALGVIGMGFHRYATTYRNFIPNGENRVSELSRILRAGTRPESVLIVFGQDWNPVLPYTAERRALMFPFPLEWDEPTRINALDRLAGEKIGALVATGDHRPRLDLLLPVIRRFNLAPAPVVKGPDADVYLPVDDVAWSAAVLQTMHLGDFRIESRGGRVVVADLPPAVAPVFAMMNPRPREAFAQYGLGLNNIGDQPVFGAHPVTELIFALPPNARRLRAGFGLLPGAYANASPDATDGVLFDVILRRPDGTTEKIAERLLQPATVATDRGTQELDLPLPAGIAGDLILRTAPGPAHNLSFDWAYWSFITIQ